MPAHFRTSAFAALCLLFAVCLAVAAAPAGERPEASLEPSIPASQEDDFESDEDESDDGSPLEPTPGKAGRRGFRYGTILEYWFLEPGDRFSRMPHEPSLTGMIDDSKQYFLGNAMLRDNELKQYVGRQGVLQWTAYFRVTKPGKHVFALSFKGSDEPSWSGAALAFNDETKATATVGKDASAAVDFAAPGWYRMQVRVWWTHHSKPNFPDFAATIKVREPGSLSLRPIARKELFYKQP